MNIGQLLAQMPFGPGLETALPVPAEAMNAESQALQNSPFADILHDISPKGTSSVQILQGGAKAQQVPENVLAEANDITGQLAVIMSADEKQLLTMASDSEKIIEHESMEPERIPVDTDNQQLIEVQNSQNVIISSSVVQLAPELPFAGRMPEAQIAEKQNMTSRDLSITPSKGAEASVDAVTQKLSGISQNQELIARTDHVTAIVTSETAPESVRPVVATVVTPVFITPEATTLASLEQAQPEYRPKTTTVVSNTPAQAEFEPAIALSAEAEPVATMEQDADRSSVRSAVTPLSPTQAAASPVVAQAVQANRTEPLLEVYSQTSSRPFTIAVPSTQPIIAGESRISQPTVTAEKLTPAPPVVTSEATPSISLAPLASSMSTVQVAEEQAGSEPVTQPAAPAPRVTAAIAVAETVVPSPSAAKVVPAATTEPSVNKGNTGAAVLPVLPAMAAASPAVSPAELVNRTEPVLAAVSPAMVPASQANRTELLLEAYYQTSSRPATIAAPATLPLVAGESRISPAPATVTAEIMPLSPTAVTSESTPSITPAPLASSLSTAPATVKSPEQEDHASAAQPAVSAPRVSAAITVAEPAIAPAAPAAAVVPAATTDPTADNSNIRSAVKPVLNPLAAVSPAVSPAAQVNRTEPLLEAYYQKSSSPAKIADPVTQPLVAGESRISQSAVTAEILPPSPTAVTSESKPTISLAPLASSLSTTPESPEQEGTASATLSAASTPRVTAAITSNSGKVVQDAGPLRQVAASENRISEQPATVTPGSIKEPASFDSGEESLGNGNEGTEQNLNGQAHLMAVQQSKTEQPVSIASPITQTVSEKSASESMDHVVQQVKEHLTGRDFKTGTEQVVIRLTPENMGELRLNLKMENQQLRVEIVAENSMVRDTLLKHSDSLRETLAKQNITMESFDVVTSGGQRGFEQNDRGWKQMAQQQFMTGTSAGGYRYRVPEVDVPIVPQYGSRNQYAMVDVHY